MKSIFTKCKQLFSKKTFTATNTCFFCKRKAPDLRSYKNEQNQGIKVCNLCVEYAERRMFQKC